MSKAEFNWPDLIISSARYIFLLRNKEFTVLLDADTFDDKERKAFYGITWTKYHLFLAELEYILKFDSSFNIVDRISFTDKKLHKNFQHAGTHQITQHDNKIYTANTNHNLIRVIDSETSEILDSSSCGYKSGEDYNHFNSVYHKDEHMYVCAHNHKFPSFILKMDKEFNVLRKYFDIGTRNHNIYLEDGYIYTLDSLGMCFRRIKEDTEEVKIINIKELTDQGQIFLRGLARTEEHFFIGITTKESIRKDREKNPSWVLCLNNDFDVVGVMRLPKNTQIQEIRLLKDDLAHNNPYEFPLL